VARARSSAGAAPCSTGSPAWRARARERASQWVGQHRHDEGRDDRGVALAAKGALAEQHGAARHLDEAGLDVLGEEADLQRRLAPGLAPERVEAQLGVERREAEAPELRRAFALVAGWRAPGLAARGFVEDEIDALAAGVRADEPEARHRLEEAQLGVDGLAVERAVEAHALRVDGELATAGGDAPHGLLTRGRARGLARALRGARGGGGRGLARRLAAGRLARRRILRRWWQIGAQEEQRVALRDEGVRRALRAAAPPEAARVERGDAERAGLARDDPGATGLVEGGDDVLASRERHRGPGRGAASVDALHVARRLVGGVGHGEHRVCAADREERDGQRGAGRLAERDALEGLGQRGRDDRAGVGRPGLLAGAGLATRRGRRGRAGGAEQRQCEERSAPGIRDDRAASCARAPSPRLDLRAQRMISSPASLPAGAAG